MCSHFVQSAFAFTIVSCAAATARAEWVTLYELVGLGGVENRRVDDPAAPPGSRDDCFYVGLEPLALLERATTFQDPHIFLKGPAGHLFGPGDQFRFTFTTGWNASPYVQFINVDINGHRAGTGLRLTANRTYSVGPLSPVDGPLDSSDMVIALHFVSGAAWQTYQLHKCEWLPLQGDFDADGDVDGDDFLLWQAGFGIETGAARSDGDADMDGDVDGDDFLLWQAGFGGV